MNATELLALAARVPKVVGEWYSSGDSGMEDMRYGPMSSAAARDIMVARCVHWLVERGGRMFTAARFGEGDYRIDIGTRNFPMPRGDSLLVALVDACENEAAKYPTED